jgi:hypothetical protein
MLRRMIRVMLLPIVGVVALLLFAGPASAAPRVPNVTPFGPVPFDAGVLCPFPVTLEGSDGQLVRTTLPDGTTILTGPFVLTITNTEDPENLRSATFNVSGPTFGSGGQLLLTGTAIILLFDFLAPPDAGILAINGRGTVDANQDFNFETFKGRSSDVCQQLTDTA